MELRPGYKQTEVGVIPEEWELRQLSEHFKIYAGGDVPKHSTSQIQSASHPYPIFANALQNKGLYGYTNERRSKADSITITARGSLGHAEYRDEPFFPIVRLLVLEPIGQLDARFTTYAINERVKFAIESTGVPQLTAPQVGKYSVVSPRALREQRAIAGALSDVDALLGGLDRLIAKKRDLKQAAMQQLLTGQTRLPGFHGEWVVKELGQLGSISGAGVDKKIHPGESLVRLVNYMDVYRRSIIRSTDLNHVVSASRDQTARCAVLKGDVFFTPSSEMPFDIAASAVAIEDIPDACYSYHVVRLRLDEDWDVSFRAYAFKTEAFLCQAARTSEGSGVRYVITQSKFRQLAIRYPSDKAEQCAIAAVLSDMDSELVALEARREKTRDLKQAMMQELLTGKTRLVPAGAANA